MFNGSPRGIPFDEAVPGRGMESAAWRCEPRHVAVIASRIPEGLAASQDPGQDEYCGWAPGINPGMRGSKEKWGGEPFLPYE